MHNKKIKVQAGESLLTPQAYNIFIVFSFYYTTEMIETKYFVSLISLNPELLRNAKS